MNKSPLALLALIVIAGVAAPVIASERLGMTGVGKCSIFAKYDKRSKTCRWKY